MACRARVVEGMVGMENRILRKAGFRHHRKILTGIFALVLLVSVLLTTVVTIWVNGRSYMADEIERAGFGDVTVWVKKVPDIKQLLIQLSSKKEVGEIHSQSLIFSDYEVQGKTSDSQGQLILYRHEENRYRFFEGNQKKYTKAPVQIEEGQMYVSPSMVSVMGVELGDEITFPIARNGNNVKLKIAGFYEDPFMGSSMIGMKGFLISEKDYEKISQTIQKSSFEALAERGEMLHVFAEDRNNISTAELNRVLNENRALPMYTEFIYSRHAILNFMLLLQNAFCGLLLAFTLILLCVVFVIISHSIEGLLEQEYKNFGILKTIGFTGKQLGIIQQMQYLLVILPGMFIGILFSLFTSKVMAAATWITTGILIPTKLPVIMCGLLFTGILLLFTLVLGLKLHKISKIAPIKAIRGETDGIPYLPKQVHRQTVTYMQNKSGQVSSRRLELWLAFRQLLSGRKRYFGLFVVAFLLTFFISVVGRMDIWLGPDGKGLMDAFHPADLDIGSQALGGISLEDIEKRILKYSDISDSYLLAMPEVSIEGINYSANVISEPERFHIQEGETCSQNNQVVLTESAAADLNVSIGDSILVQGEKGKAEYIISGIYQCANDMGNNIGMNREAYLQIGNESTELWCHHFLLSDTSHNKQIMEELQASYGGDIYVHENTWPGLFGILSAMKALMIFLYVIVAVFVFLITTMTGGKILNAEQRDMGIYLAMGFTVKSLRKSFALRFALLSVIGSLAGVVFGAMVTNPLVSSVMKLAGISNFASYPSLIFGIFPALVVTLLFTLFSWLAAGKIKTIDLSLLMAD